MRLQRLGWGLFVLGLAGSLAGCGGDSKSAATLSVTCGGSLALTGAQSVSVLGAPVNGRATITFPDPANRG